MHDAAKDFQAAFILAMSLACSGASANGPCVRAGVAGQWIKRRLRGS
jgi:hypothetical protein